MPPSQLFGLSAVFLSIAVLCNSSLEDGFCQKEEDCSQQVQNTRVDISCHADDDCQLYIANSVCEGDTCKCKPPSLLSSDMAKCLNASKGYGENCEDNMQCSARLTNGGICLENSCKCGDGFHYLKGKCWKSSGLREPCTVDEQCYAGEEYVGFRCNNNACECRVQYYERHGSYCRRKRDAGEFCSFDEDCDCNDGTCQSNKCVCGSGSGGSAKSAYTETNIDEDFENLTTNQVESVDCDYGYFPVESECKKELGMDCVGSDHACNVTSSTCFDGICSCVENNFYSSVDGRKCLKGAKPSTDISLSTCLEGIISCAVLGPYAVCKGKNCDCVDGTHWVPEEYYCRPSRGLEQTCTIDSDCFVAKGTAKCETGVCKCSTNTHPAAGQTECRLDAKIGDECGDTSDCILENNICNGTCLCMEGYYEENGVCKNGIGAPCGTGCEDENSDCRDSICQCQFGFTPSDDYKQCLPVVDYQETCQQTSQCNATLGALVECKDNKCQCISTAHVSGGSCHKTVALGGKCNNKRQCAAEKDLASVICQNGICKCQYGYILTDNQCIRDESENSIAVNKRKSFTTLIFTSSIFWLLIRL